jgi:hypothetical protein
VSAVHKFSNTVANSVPDSVPNLVSVDDITHAVSKCLPNDVSVAACHDVADACPFNPTHGAANCTADCDTHIYSDIGSDLWPIIWLQQRAR